MDGSAFADSGTPVRFSCGGLFTLVRGMYTSTSGALVAQAAVDTIANNLANVDTAGFKRARCCKCSRSRSASSTASRPIRAGSRTR
ncbi:MAG: flagellar basal body protein [Candidatus Elarobacter sp.]